MCGAADMPLAFTQKYFLVLQWKRLRAGLKIATCVPKMILLSVFLLSWTQIGAKRFLVRKRFGGTCSMWPTSTELPSTSSSGRRSIRLSGTNKNDEWIITLDDGEVSKTQRRIQNSQNGGANHREGRQNFVVCNRGFWTWLSHHKSQYTATMGPFV